MKESTIEEKKKWISEEMERVRKNIFMLEIQEVMYSNLAGSGKAIKQQYVNVAAQVKSQIKENQEYFEQLEREAKKL